MPALAAEIVDDPARLAALEPQWWALWRLCADATPFTSPAWLLPWLEVFAPAALRTITIHAGDRLVALAPLWLEDGPLGRRLLPLGIGISDIFDVLVDPGIEGAGEALARSLAGMSDWDICELEALPSAAAGLSIPTPEGCRVELAEQDVRPVLWLLMADEDPLGCLPARKRRKLRMACHRVERRDGRVAVVGPGELDGFLADLVHLHGLRWTEREESGVLKDETVLRFHARALPRLQGAGIARLYRVSVESQTIGAYYGFGHAGRTFAYLGGFDPGFAFESPGTVLLGHAIAASTRDGARSFDFLRGSEPYKYEWGARDEPNWHRRFIRNERE